MKRFAAACGLLATMVAGAALAQEKTDKTDKTSKDLDGAYKATSLQKGDKVAEKELTDALSFVIKGEDLTVVIDKKDDRQEKKAKIKIDAAKTPAAIDITPADGPERGKTFPGIYKLDKGELTIAFAEKGDRPKDFKAEGDVTLLKLKKDEKK
jgi:uncharacterized protein (TIGR03067 family)